MRILQASDVLNEENIVIVNIWTSAKNKVTSGVNVGHISIQLSKEDHVKNNNNSDDVQYISLWPARRNNADEYNQACNSRPIRRLFNLFQERPVDFKTNYLDDAKSEAAAEGAEGEAYIYANVRIALYGLNKLQIKEEFLHKKSNLRGWVIRGSNLLERVLSSDTHENCASFALAMLRKGGMYNDINSCWSKDVKSIVTPDDLVKHLLEAKIREISNHPYTNNWKFVGETSRESWEKIYEENKSNKCVII